MRYQNPTTNPFNQYWEEQLVYGGVSRHWKNALSGLAYAYSEYVFSNIILVLSILIKALSFKPVFEAVSILYHTYGLKWAIKRTMDVIGAIVGLILASPVFIIIPIIIRLNSAGAIFYRQERIGQNRRRRDLRNQTSSVANDRRATDRRQIVGHGRPFMIIKFRTMSQDAEQKTGPVWASKRDPRITRVGAILRATRIDEIPQLVNVLRGDMSLVGPRPERAYFIDRLKVKIDGYERRLMVKPGVTGLAQVEYKYDESEEDVKVKVRYDLSYIYNFRIFNDVKILLKTVYVVLAAKGM